MRYEKKPEKQPKGNTMVAKQKIGGKK